MLGALRHRNYRLFLTGQVISTIGTWMQSVAMPWLAIQLTHSGLLVGLVLAVQFTPVLLGSQLPAFALDQSESLSEGDAGIRRFLSAAELIETDLWQQYNELGGVQDKEVPGGSGNPAYTAALEKLDGDMPQYIHDNTEDEFTNQNFINAYLASKGADTINLDQFRTLPSSKATGAQQIGRLTNLMQLTVDTSWWTRYRSRTENPDLDPEFKFPGGPGTVRGTVSSNSQNQCRSRPSGSPAGHRQHRGISLRIH